MTQARQPKPGSKLRLIGWTLLLIGLPIAIWGIYTALAPVVNAYAQALDDPLSDKMPEDGKAMSKNMLMPILIGAVGAMMATLGSTLLSLSFVRRMLARFRA
jgi:hypothetical protein